MSTLWVVYMMVKEISFVRWFLVHILRWSPLVFSAPFHNASPVPVPPPATFRVSCSLSYYCQRTAPLDTTYTHQHDIGTRFHIDATLRHGVMVRTHHPSKHRQTPAPDLAHQVALGRHQHCEKQTSRPRNSHFWIGPPRFYL